MDFKIEIVSSAFDNNIYPKGVACFKATISFSNINFNLYNVYTSKSLNFNDLMEADNECQNLLIKKAVNLLKFLVYKTQFELLNPNRIEYEENNKKEYDNFEEKVDYKKKTLEISANLGIPLEKLSKISLKVNNTSNLSELSISEWKKIYDFIKDKVENSKLFQTQNIKDSNRIDKFDKFDKSNKLDKFEKEKMDYDNEEIILDEEWQEIL